MEVPAPDLACPKCGSIESLGTVERIYGVAACYGISLDGPRHAGWTDVDWNSSTTIGVCCRSCFWESFDPKWINELVEAKVESGT